MAANPTRRHSRRTPPHARRLRAVVVPVVVPLPPGRRAETLRALRAEPASEGWLEPLAIERMPSARLGPPGRIARLGALGRSIPVERLRDGSRAPVRHSMRPRQVALAGLVAAALGLLLNAGALERSAETAPYGTGRMLALDVLRPIAAIAHATGLDRPRAALDAALGNDGGNASQSVATDSIPAPNAPTGALQPVAGVTGTGLRDRPTLAPSWPAALAAALPPTGASTAEATSTTRDASRPGGAATPPHRFQVVTVGRVPSPTQPLRVWVGGDSIAGYLGQGMVDLGGQRGDLAVHSHYQVSTGLTRPDYYDWPAHLEEDMRAYDPEVVILLVGGNDDQPLSLGDGSYADFGSQAWIAEYSRRVGAVMDGLLAEHRMVVWVGLPVMRSADFDSRMQVENAAYRNQAAPRPGVLYVDARVLLSGAGGGYSPYLPDASGAPTLVRAPDGVHLSPDGGRRLASTVLDDILGALRADDVDVPVTPGPT